MTKANFIFFDIDGVLLIDGRPSNLYVALRHHVQTGLIDRSIVGVRTALPYKSAEAIIADIDLRGPMVFENGALYSTSYPGVTKAIDTQLAQRTKDFRNRVQYLAQRARIKYLSYNGTDKIEDTLKLHNTETIIMNANRQFSTTLYSVNTDLLERVIEQSHPEKNGFVAERVDDKILVFDPQITKFHGINRASKGHHSLLVTDYEREFLSGYNINVIEYVAASEISQTEAASENFIRKIFTTQRGK